MSVSVPLQLVLSDAPSPRTAGRREVWQADLERHGGCTEPPPVYAVPPWDCAGACRRDGRLSARQAVAVVGVVAI